MARLEGKRALDIGNRALELADQVVEGGALVPPSAKSGRISITVLKLVNAASKAR